MPYRIYDLKIMLETHSKWIFLLSVCDEVKTYFHRFGETRNNIIKNDGVPYLCN